MTSRRQAESTGCGCLLGGVLFLVFGTWGLALLAFVMASPVIVPYGLLIEPRQFRHDETWWLLLLCASPVAAYFLAAAPLPKRVRARMREDLDLDWSDPKDRVARWRRRGLQTLLLLAATSLTTLALIAGGDTGTGPHAFRQTTVLIGVVLVPCVLLPVAFRLWDRWSPPIGEAVTVEMIQAAERDVGQEIGRVRAQNAEVRKMLREVEQMLASARQEVGFHARREKHYESFRCADLAHQRYESVKGSWHAMSRMASRARATAAPRLVPLRDPRTGRRVPAQKQHLRVGAAALSKAGHVLQAETARGLQDVHSLNIRTGDLRDHIRDSYGTRGQRWYDNLVERRDHARAAEAGSRRR